MNKHLFAALLLALCLAVFTACSPADDTTTASTASETAAPAPENQVITIAQALELCGEEGSITQKRYYIQGIVESIDNAAYGAMTISDATGTISVYDTYSENGSVPYGELNNKPYKGDEVLLSCILQNYQGTKEVKNAWLIEVKHNEPDVDLTAYTEMTIASARDAEKGSKVKVTGIVAQIVYADGLIPSGIYLVDETNSILVHDSDLAQRVNIGNQITIVAEKTWWILDSEQANAEKFGYKGSCQLENAVLLENDDRTDKGFDHAWIPSSTILDILNTPVSENITNTIFRVPCTIKKVEGKGFVNYYIYDLDETTGTYVYTQCGGQDFAWLDQYLDTVQELYVSVINAKSTETDCIYRLQPIQIIPAPGSTIQVSIPEHVVKYYGMTQFQSVYSGDPMLELTTQVSSQLLDFQDASLHYTSSNPSIINFKEVDGKLYMRGIMPGTATITITGTYDGKSYSESMDITIGGAVTVSYGTVREAIDAPAGSRVTLKGIVGPSVVNQPGFYLVDNTGVIPVAMGEDMLKTLKPGNEIILEGVRDYRNPKSSGKCIGQTYIKDPAILTNHYGTQEYATDSFISGKTLAEFYALNPLEDHSTEVYIMRGKLEFVETDFYTSLKFTDGTTAIQLYCANAGQYSFLEAFRDQEITVELAACNWNSKSYYTGCILAVYTENGKIINPLNFQ